MSFFEKIDQTVFLWINESVGRFSLLDQFAELAASDYLIPVAISLVLLGLWFSGDTSSSRTTNQFAVMTAIVAVVIANLVVEASNEVFFRARPYEILDSNVLFYKPTDSSFPSNPTAAGLAMGLSVWFWNKKPGRILIVIALLLGIARVYVGVCYPFDVVGGATIALGATVLSKRLLTRFQLLALTLLRSVRSIFLA